MELLWNVNICFRPQTWWLLPQHRNTVDEKGRTCGLPEIRLEDTIIIIIIMMCNNNNKIEKKNDHQIIQKKFKNNNFGTLEHPCCYIGGLNFFGLVELKIGRVDEACCGIEDGVVLFRSLLSFFLNIGLSDDYSYTGSTLRSIYYCIVWFHSLVCATKYTIWTYTCM